jgi:predicted RNase H-like HicB family nuclease
MLIPKYASRIQWSEEDDEWVVTYPSLPGLSALGATAKEAAAEASIALKLFIETYQSNGILLPAPDYYQYVIDDRYV